MARSFPRTADARCVQSSYLERTMKVKTRALRTFGLFPAAGCFPAARRVQRGRIGRALGARGGRELGRPDHHPAGPPRRGGQHRCTGRADRRGAQSRRHRVHADDGSAPRAGGGDGRARREARRRPGRTPDGRPDPRRPGAGDPDRCRPGWSRRASRSPSPATTRRDFDHSEAGHDDSMMGMLTEQEMTQLARARGSAFDRLFLQGMIRHHRGALAMAENGRGRGRRRAGRRAGRRRTRDPDLRDRDDAGAAGGPLVGLADDAADQVVPPGPDPVEREFSCSVCCTRMIASKGDRSAAARKAMSPRTPSWSSR